MIWTLILGEHLLGRGAWLDRGHAEHAHTRPSQEMFLHRGPQDELLQEQTCPKPRASAASSGGCQGRARPGATSTRNQEKDSGRSRIKRPSKKAHFLKAGFRKCDGLFVLDGKTFFLLFFGLVVTSAASEPMLPFAGASFWMSLSYALDLFVVFPFSSVDDLLLWANSFEIHFKTNWNLLFSCSIYLSVWKLSLAGVVYRGRFFKR